MGGKNTISTTKTVIIPHTMKIFPTLSLWCVRRLLNTKQQPITLRPTKQPPITSEPLMQDTHPPYPRCQLPLPLIVEELMVRKFISLTSLIALACRFTLSETLQKSRDRDRNSVFQGVTRGKFL